MTERKAREEKVGRPGAAARPVAGLSALPPQSSGALLLVLLVLLPPAAQTKGTPAATAAEVRGRGRWPKKVPGGGGASWGSGAEGGSTRGTPEA